MDVHSPNPRDHHFQLREKKKPKASNYPTKRSNKLSANTHIHPYNILQQKELGISLLSWMEILYLLMLIA